MLFRSGQAGLDITAWYYNANRSWHGGHLEGVVTGKNLAPHQHGAIVEDVERGFSDSLRALPWQTDTCLGNWHYERALFERHAYKSAASVVTRLCDVVSKNGNLLLSVPIRGNGSIDSDEVDILKDIGNWMQLNGEAIFNSRPWRVYGEGPTRERQGNSESIAYTPDDLRFTTRSNNLYILALGWVKAESLSVRSLFRAAGEVRRVELLGCEATLDFKQDHQGLQVHIPSTVAGKSVPVFRVQGNGLV